MVDVDRILAAMQRRGDKLIGRAFTDDEAAYCRRSQCPERRFAGRFAAKEAVMKALGRGWFQGMPFKEIEVVRDESPEGYGRPSIRLTGTTADLAERLGATSIHVSITHEHRAAIAFVIIER